MFDDAEINSVPFLFIFSATIKQIFNWTVHRLLCRYRHIETNVVYCTVNAECQSITHQKSLWNHFRPWILEDRKYYLYPFKRRIPPECLKLTQGRRQKLKWIPGPFARIGKKSYRPHEKRVTWKFIEVYLINSWIMKEYPQHFLKLLSY